MQWWCKFASSMEPDKHSWALSLALLFLQQFRTPRVLAVNIWITGNMLHSKKVTVYNFTASLLKFYAMPAPLGATQGRKQVSLSGTVWVYFSPSRIHPIGQSCQHILERTGHVWLPGGHVLTYQPLHWGQDSWGTQPHSASSHQQKWYSQTNPGENEKTADNSRGMAALEKRQDDGKSQKVRTNKGQYTWGRLTATNTAPYPTPRPTDTPPSHSDLCHHQTGPQSSTHPQTHKPST